MKRLKSFLLAVTVLSVAVFAVACSKKIGMEKVKPIGTLTLLNLSQEETAELSKKRGFTEILFIQDGYGEKPTDKSDWEYFLAHSKDYQDIPMRVIFYDNLNSMLMALESGEIAEMEVPQSVGEYLCANNKNLLLSMEFDKTITLNSFGQHILDLTQSSDFSLMLLKKNVALRDKFNDAINSMRADGTLAKLEKEYVEDAIAGAKLEHVSIKKIPGAPVIKIAVTGDLPPLDYVAPDGTPAGFNTAVLAEISKRIGINIELVNIDAGARSTALASGIVDIAFWTRANAATNITIEEVHKELGKRFSEEEISLLKQMNDVQQWTSYGNIDIPDNTIITEPYYHDYITILTTTTEVKRKLDILKEKLREKITRKN
ncbi:MAG: transporter substrate-binding domain-containing protein [Treponema sp.]|nr:transporter substrate-binding domain-containing protein [Treponema sp.]